MSTWSLSQLLSGLHDELQQKLAIARKSFAHTGTKGDASEQVWLDMLQDYLPQRYQAASAHVVNSLGNFSDQLTSSSSRTAAHRFYARLGFVASHVGMKLHLRD